MHYDIIIFICCHEIRVIIYELGNSVLLWHLITQVFIKIYTNVLMKFEWEQNTLN